MSDIQIVGVHGIRQWDTNAYQLGTDWRTDLAHGITRHLGPGAVVPGLVTPYYGDVFPKTRWFQLSQPDLEDLTDPEEIDFVVTTLEEYDPALEPVEPAPTLGVPPAIRPKITGWFTALDRKWGQGAGERVVTRVRELYGYLHNPSAADEARQRIANAIIESNARLVIAHSLGSVIVYDMFQKGLISAASLQGSVETLITCGSPLSWPSIRRNLDAADDLQLPGSVSWVNIFDPKDPVTAGQGLSDKAPAVRDIEVDNEDDAHAARRYLRQKAMALAVEAALG